MIDAGRLKVAIRDGRTLVALPNDVLFDSAKTSIKPDGHLHRQPRHCQSVTWACVTMLGVVRIVSKVILAHRLLDVRRVRREIWRCRSPVPEKPRLGIVPAHGLVQ